MTFPGEVRAAGVLVPKFVGVDYSIENKLRIRGLIVPYKYRPPPSTDDTAVLWAQWVKRSTCCLTTK
jgi:hypothetical protein